MRFSPWLSVFLLYRWMYKHSENNTILELKITVLSQKSIVFCGLVNKYCSLILSLSWHMRRKRYKHYQHGLQRDKRTVWIPRNITDSARKRLKRAWDIILIHNTIYLGDQYMNDGRKRNKAKWNTFYHACVQFHFPFCGPAAHITYRALLTCKKP